MPAAEISTPVLTVIESQEEMTAREVMLQAGGSYADVQRQLNEGVAGGLLVSFKGKASNGMVDRLFHSTETAPAQAERAAKLAAERLAAREAAEAEKAAQAERTRAEADAAMERISRLSEAKGAAQARRAREAAREAELEAIDDSPQEAAVTRERNAEKMSALMGRLKRS